MYFILIWNLIVFQDTGFGFSQEGDQLQKLSNITRSRSQPLAQKDNNGVFGGLSLPSLITDYYNKEKNKQENQSNENQTNKNHPFSYQNERVSHSDE